MSETYVLAEEIVKMSKADIFVLAVKEWDWVGTYYIDSCEEGISCLCGHFPIKECCEIENRITGAKTIVGNCCIKKFMDTDSDLVFQAIKRVSKDNTKSFNVAALNHAFRDGAISENEFNYYKRNMRRRNIFGVFKNQKIKLNKKILAHFRKKE